MTQSGIRVRQSVRSLQDAYDNGDKKPLENLVRAWKGICGLPPTDKRSFFVLAGYHGEPFQYRRQVDALSSEDTYTYWGGYCNHGNVLFPTWHRVYVLKLEDALRTIVPDVTLPYWDETSDDTLARGIPNILTDPTFELDGEMIDNPLRSFLLPTALSDAVPSDDRLYEKPTGYRTVRYPLSGLVGTADARRATLAHNASYPDLAKNVELLNENIKAWMRGDNPRPKAKHPTKKGVLSKFEHCLLAPNYTVFSNTTSAGQGNLDVPSNLVTALEAPHNDIHLAVGGFDVPAQGEDGQIAGSNGDMGENNTAAMDPIFFFHHCNVDRMFWIWQQLHGATDTLDIIPRYAGTSSSDSQGPTPGIAPGTPLDLDTPLNPFVKDGFGTLYTSRDCIDIERQLGYTYAAGSLANRPRAASAPSASKLTVRGIDRALFQGSFVLRAYAIVRETNGVTTEYYLGHHSVLSRHNVVKCANCLTHLEVIAHFSLDDVPSDAIDRAEFLVDIQHRGPGLSPKLVRQFEVQV